MTPKKTTQPQFQTHIQVLVQAKPVLANNKTTTKKREEENPLGESRGRKVESMILFSTA